MNEIGEQWRSWITENLNRGVPRDRLFEQMVASGFNRIATEDAIAMQAGWRMPVPSNREERTAAALSNLADYREDLAAELRPILTLKSPRISLFESAIGRDQCVELIAEASSRMKVATIVDSVTGHAEQHSSRRSDVAMFNRAETPLVDAIERQLSSLLRIPIDHGEGLQVVRYGVGGEYRPHFDFFPDLHAGSAAHTERGGQRIATMILYLNNVLSGGETDFPDAGVTVRARQGFGCYFSSVDDDGLADDRSLHAGRPVLDGEKWIATKWYRRNPYV